MATTNYSLPTLESTALFDLVTDYNALSNATDSALASVAGLIPTESITEMEGQISALQTLTGSQGTQITTLQSQMSTANGNISTLQSGLETANTNIGQLQSGLQATNSNVTSAEQKITNLTTNLEPVALTPDELTLSPATFTILNGSLKISALGSGNLYATLVCCPQIKLINLSVYSKQNVPLGWNSSSNYAGFKADLTAYNEYLPTRPMFFQMQNTYLDTTSTQTNFYGLVDPETSALYVIATCEEAGLSNFKAYLGTNMPWFYGIGSQLNA